MINPFLLLKSWNLHITLTITTILLINNQLKAQYYPESFYATAVIDSTLDNSLFLRIENSNFFKNDEYFNDIVQGYTLIGYHVNPKLQYFPSKNSTIEAGVHLLKYSGIDNFTKVIPTFSFSYQAAKAVEIIIGTLKGSVNHQMIEPLFGYELFFTDHIENGLQFLFDTKNYKGDVWINWQQFIFKGDSIQEIFTSGISNRIFLNNKESFHRFSIPIQTVFVHHGGQINKTNNAVTTMNNSAIGLNYTFTSPGGFIKSIAVEPLFVTFKDMSTQHLLPFTTGYGIYTQAFVRSSLFDLRLTHWYGDSFLTSRGDPIFQSQSTINPLHIEETRNLLTARLLFEKKIITGIHLGAGFEGYYDLHNHYFDYWYMFYINFSKDFFIKCFKKQEK